MVKEQVDTIVAQATPRGQGGVAIIRISGPKVISIIEQIFKRELPPRKATLAAFHDHQATLIDKGIALFFPGPNSFTGEDVCEFQGHGGTVVVDLLIKHCLTLGARLANPGEFSLRAFLNGRIDLVQAEAIADLIHASSEHAARSAARSLQGEFSQAINLFNQKLIQLRMFIEAAIDFSDEPIDLLADHHILNSLAELQNQIALVEERAKCGSLLREGIRVVLAGEPNVGKSSLLNCLSGQDLAIVSAIPGTTRDVLRDNIVMDGLPLHIIDTAGLRSSTDEIEQEGIKRAYREIDQADLILFLIDASKEALIPETLKPTHTILVFNKRDLVQDELLSLNQFQGFTAVAISARFGLNIDELKMQIKTKVGYKTDTEGVFLARRRHLQALSLTQRHLLACVEQLTLYQAFELAAEELRLAHQVLSTITGEFSADDLLGEIFSHFCIGK